MSEIRPEVADALWPYIDALGQAEETPDVRRVVEMLGGSPRGTEREVGAPARHDRWLTFASGGEIVVQDGVVAVVFFHLEAAGFSAGGFDVTQVLPGVPSRPDRDDVRAALGDTEPFGVDLLADRFDVGARVKATYERVPDASPWLVRLMLTPESTYAKPDPIDDLCPSCSDLLVRTSGRLDVDATIASLRGAAADGRVREDPSRPSAQLMRSYEASGEMPWVECHAECRTCRRTACFVLRPGAAPTFGHYAYNDAIRHPRTPMPPRVGRSGDTGAMTVVDHEPSEWFLLAKGDDLFLDARYTHGWGKADYNALIQLTPQEKAVYEDRGHDVAHSLARGIGDPRGEDSPWRSRDLYQGPEERNLQAQVSAAVARYRNDAAWAAKDQT